MALIIDATHDWSAGTTLAADEIWQARSGEVYISTTADPAPNDGLLLVYGQGVLVRSGNTIRYRKAGDTAALVVREVV